MIAAAYAGSEMTWNAMRDSAWNLAANSKVDKIYCLIDGDFISNMPKQCEFINITNQTWFKPDGLNFNTRFTKFTLMRTIYYKLFPDLDRILSLDVDTLVVKDISELWDLDLTNYYYAGVPEKYRCKPNIAYINAGVVMFNLEKLRDGTGDKIVSELNRVRYDFPDQDAMAYNTDGKVLFLPCEYNDTPYTGHSADPKIKHWAGHKTYTHLPEWREAAIYTPK